MSKEICISSTPHETRLAIIEDEQLTEVYYERENEYTLAGSIYKGRVTRVLPGMQSAFVDLGLERDAFLYVTDFLEEQEDSAEFERVPANGQGDHVPDSRERNGRPQQERGSNGRDSKEARTGAGLEPEGKANPGAGTAAASQEQFEEGTRRWRGRRGRRNRSGAKPAGWQQNAQPRPQETAVAEAEPMDFEPEAISHSVYEERADAIPGQALSVLPGESLSKYGQAPTSETVGDSEPVQSQPKPFTSSKPSTLVDTPIQLESEGLLVGESLSRYSNRTGPAEPVSSPSEQSADGGTEAVEAEAAIPMEDEIELEAGRSASEPVAAPGADPLPAVSRQAAPLEDVQEEVQVEEVQHEEEQIEFEPSDASASYRIDRSAPSEFRVSGVTEAIAEFSPAEEDIFPAIPEIERYHQQDSPEGEMEFAPAGRLKPEESRETGPGNDEEFDDVLDLQSAAALDGLVEEEEVSEEEEYDFTPLYAHADEHDLEDMEEETLDRQAMAGAGIDDLVRDKHIELRVNAEPDDLTIEDEELEGEESEEEGEEEQEMAGQEEARSAPAADQPSRRERQDRQDQRREGRGGRHERRRHGQRRQTAQTSQLPIISELLKQGQEILVQIAKEPIAKKGARITSHIALPGRFLVFMPTVNHVGVSRKISSEEERQRLKRILISEKGAGAGGFIVRTAADGASEDELRADIRFLIGLWTEIKQRADSGKAPALIYHDLNLVERILRDQVSDNFSTIWVDNEVEYERIVRFLNRFQPSLVRRAKLYTKETPLFEQFGIQDEIGKALKSKVWLKSGGSIVINQTEALVAIDINTGKYVGKTARLEDTILKTNLDAIPEIVRQIRLRDLGGIIVIDFIDMDERKNRHKVMQALEEALKADRAPSKVLQFNDFGLVAITRKRVKQSLERTLCVQCGICSGTGMTKSPATVCNEIYVEMRKMQRHLERHDVLLRVHPEVVKVLKGNNARWLGELEEMSGKTIIVKSDPALHPEQFDIQ